MGKIIQDLWILSESGIVLFSRVFNEDVNEQLFGGFITALNNFAQTMRYGELSNFSLKKTNFFIYKQDDLLFITNSPKKVNEKRTMKALKKISDRFFDLYADILSNWDGETDYFDNFKSEIEDNLMDPVKDFWSDF
ncbi:MAG: hypothetical protein GF329_03840 [Candidatus Lokiarchaeota archaeon]|nr:hypothetical protein [Candidatus Lokiarchaeota archaeon]